MRRGGKRRGNASAGIAASSPKTTRADWVDRATVLRAVPWLLQQARCQQPWPAALPARAIQSRMSLSRQTTALCMPPFGLSLIGKVPSASQRRNVSDETPMSAQTSHLRRNFTTHLPLSSGGVLKCHDASWPGGVEASASSGLFSVGGRGKQSYRTVAVYILGRGDARRVVCCSVVASVAARRRPDGRTAPPADRSRALSVAGGEHEWPGEARQPPQLGQRRSQETGPDQHRLQIGAIQFSDRSTALRAFGRWR